MTQELQFDIAVVGGGPAGIMAAYHAALQGRKVCLFDRKKKPGYPVRCGEAIGLRGFSASLDLRPEWVMSRSNTIVFVSPSNISVSVPNAYDGLVLDRVRLEQDLTHDAIKAGVVFYPNATVLSVNKQARGYECVTRNKTIQASCVILAEGIESRLARSLGWKTKLSLSDIETCAIARITHKNVVPETLEFFMGSHIAPRGYAWVFHRGGTTANVGLGVLGSCCEAGMPKKLLLEFIEKKFPKAEISEVHCGGVPMTKWIKPLVRDGVMLVGDAARQVNCMHGAGIGYSLYAGKVAGTIAGQSIVNGQCQHTTLTAYEKKWASFYGKQQVRSFAVKEVMVGFSDTFLDDVARSIVKNPGKKMSILKIFIKTFSQYPLLLFKVIKLLK